MIPKVEAYHQHKLSDKFFCVYLDATYIPLRRITFDREAVYIAIGIKPNGHKEVIDYRIAPSENVENWTEMLQDMKSRGLEQVFRWRCGHEDSAGADLSESSFSTLSSSCHAQYLR